MVLARYFLFGGPWTLRIRVRVSLLRVIHGMLSLFQGVHMDYIVNLPPF